jgi:hypothetical protein
MSRLEVAAAEDLEARLAKDYLSAVSSAATVAFKQRVTVKRDILYPSMQPYSPSLTFNPATHC